MHARRGKPFAHAKNTNCDIIFCNSEGDQPGYMEKLIDDARISGSLNLSNRSLTEIPRGVWTINSESPQRKAPVNFDQQDSRWWEQIPLSKLILAFNSLSIIPDSIRRLDTLTTLDLQNNRLNDISNAIGALTELRTLNLSFNQLSCLPASFIELRNLTNLNLKDNALTDMQMITDLTQLENLDLSGNKIKTIPDNISQLRCMRKLMLNQNSVLHLPGSLAHLTNVFHLDLSANGFEEFPPVFASVSKIEILNLRQNRLKKFPAFQNMPLIKELHISNNAIVEVQPSDFYNLTSLINLDLGYNKIKILPTEITLLKNLTRFDLSCNDLTSLPCEIGFMESLKFLSLDSNPIRGLMREIAKGTEAVKKLLRTRSQTGDPDSRSVTSDESSLVHKPGQNTGVIGHSSGSVDAFAVAQSGSLDLSDKKLESVPEDVWLAIRDKPVKEIRLEKNKLPIMPDEVYLFGESLNVLNLSSNQLQFIPNDVSLLMRLKHLDLSRNKLNDLPNEVSGLSTLNTLNISNNPTLGRIPNCVYNLPSLRDLLASGCKIKEIDAGKMKTMGNLALLDLSNNDISSVPPELGLCTQIQLLKLEGNCFRVPRAAILGKGTVAILEYLRSRIPE